MKSMDNSTSNRKGKYIWKKIIVGKKKSVREYLLRVLTKMQE